MDCSKACEEIYINFFTNYLYEMTPSFMICLDGDYSSQTKIPKDHLSPEIRENLPTNIQLKGPNGQTHEIRTESTKNAILLATGWNDFVSCNSLKRQDMLIFFYEGNGLFHVRKFYQNGCEITEPRGVSHSARQIGSRGTNGKGKEVAEADASSGSVMARRGPVKERKLSPSEHMEISGRSGDNFALLSNYVDTLASRNVANAVEGPSGGSIGKKIDVSVEFNLASSRTETETESWSCDSVHEVEALAPLHREVISISSGSFHENGDEVKGQCSQNLQIIKEPDNSENLDKTTTKNASKSRFVQGQKPVGNKVKKLHNKQRC